MCRPTARSNRFMVQFWRRVPCPSVGGQLLGAPGTASPLGGRGTRLYELLRSLSLILGLAVTACASASPRHFSDPAQVFPRAVVAKSDVDRAAKIEGELAKRYGELAPPGTAWFEVHTGNRPVVVSAPHATNPTRDGKLRFADAGTGSLAALLHDLAGCTAIYTTYASPSDPNYDDENEYKEQLRKLLETRKPALVIDLHASHWNRPYDVDFGTLHGRSLLGKSEVLRELANHLRNEGIGNFSQDYFAASKNATMTKWASSLGVPAIQLEISTTWTTPGPDELLAHRYAQLLQALVRFISSYSRPVPD